MDIVKKNRKAHVLDGDPAESMVLRWFDAVLKGTAPMPDVFAMISDEYARHYLDDDGYAIWTEARDAALKGDSK